MMLKFKYTGTSLGLILLLSACGGGSNKAINKFNPTEWKSDRAACNGTRERLSTDLIPQLDSLKGMNQSEVVELLGRPDITELSARNTKIYHYFYTYGGQCATDKNSLTDTNKVAATNGRTFRLRFNAIGLVNEVLK